MRKILLTLPVLLLASCGSLGGPPTTPGSTTPGSTTPETVNVTLSGPVNVTSTAPQLWEALTSPNVTRVEFFLDSISLGTDPQAPFQTSPSFTASQNGAHVIKAVATTAAGTQKTATLSVTVNIAGTTTPTQPPTGQIFIPAAGAAVGTGDGTKLGTVYVSPNAQEVDFMTLLNEVRTKGTINGTDARAGTCLEGVQPGTLKPLTFNGVMAYASRKHSEYLGSWGYEGHEELNSSHPNFYGATVGDRIRRAYSELRLGAPGMVSGGEMAAYGSSNFNLSATQTVTGFLHSPPHCQLLAQNNIASVGVGYVSAAYQDGTAAQPTRYENNWTVNFGR